MVGVAVVGLTINVPVRLSELPVNHYSRNYTSTLCFRTSAEKLGRVARERMPSKSCIG